MMNSAATDMFVLLLLLQRRGRSRKKKCEEMGKNRDNDRTLNQPKQTRPISQHSSRIGTCMSRADEGVVHCDDMIVSVQSPADSASSPCAAAAVGSRWVISLAAVTARESSAALSLSREPHTCSLLVVYVCMAL